MDTNTPPVEAAPTTEKNAPLSGTILEWTAHSTPEHDRSPRWYLMGSMLVLAFAAYGIVSADWTLTVLTLLLGGTYFLVRRAPATMATIAIQDKGFLFNGTFVSWGDCSGFWMIHTPGWTELHIRSNRGVIKRDYIVQTADIDPNAISAILSHFLQQRSDQRERLIDRIIRLCKL